MFNIIETFKDDSPNFNELVTEFIKSMVNRDWYRVGQVKFMWYNLIGFSCYTTRKESKLV